MFSPILNAISSILYEDFTGINVLFIKRFKIDHVLIHPLTFVAII